MFNRKASPTRSAKSGNSVTSSTNSVRSTMSPKVVTSNDQSRTSSIASVQKTRTPQPPSLKTANSSNQGSFDEELPVLEGLVRCEICKRSFADDRIETHRSVCQMVSIKTKKRRVYDASKARVQVRLKCLLPSTQFSFYSTGNRS